MNVTEVLAKQEYYIVLSTICSLGVLQVSCWNWKTNFFLFYYAVRIFIQIALNGLVLDKRNTKLEMILKETVVTLLMYFIGIWMEKQENHEKANIVPYPAEFWNRNLSNTVLEHNN